MKKFNMAQTGDTWNAPQLSNASFLMPRHLRVALSSGDSVLDACVTVSVSCLSAGWANDASPFVMLMS
jgi:hypothetical protein